MHLFNYDKIAADFGPVSALLLLFLWPLLFAAIGVIARLIGSENSKFNKRVEGFLRKYMEK